MDWWILDFLFNILILSSLIGLLAIVWMIILAIINMFFEE